MSRLSHWGGSHAEQNALSFAEDVAGEDQLKHSHTKKRNKRQKGLEITFDPVAHKEYVTGFHKRKLLRKKEAQRQLEEKAKKSRQEERAQKRAELRARLDLDRYMTSESEGEEEDKQDGKKDVRAFASNGVSTTVTIAPFSLNNDSDCDADVPSQEAKEDHPSSGKAREEPLRGNGPEKAGNASQQPKGTFSKCARRLPEGKQKAGMGVTASQKKQKGKGMKRNKR